MLYISGNNGKEVNIVNTQTNQQRVCSIEQVREILIQGKRIGGAKLMSDKSVAILCQSPNFLHDFTKKILPTLATLALLSNKKDAASQISAIEDLAKEFGVIDLQDELKIDLKGQTILLPYQDMLIKFDKNGNYDIVNNTTMLNVTDPKVVSYSHLGFEAFKFMYLEVGGKRYTMVELTQLLHNVNNSFNPSDIKYIGVTPSNRMFKFWLRNGDIYSVQYNTIAKVREEAQKVKNISVSDYYFKQYVTGLCNNTALDPNGLAIIKVSFKDYSNKMYDVADLHAKYKTLQDVFILY